MFKTHHRWTDIRKQVFNHIYICAGSQSRSETLDWCSSGIFGSFGKDLGDEGRYDAFWEGYGFILLRLKVVSPLKMTSITPIKKNKEQTVWQAYNQTYIIAAFVVVCLFFLITE